MTFCEMSASALAPNQYIFGASTKNLISFDARRIILRTKRCLQLACIKHNNAYPEAVIYIFINYSTIFSLLFVSNNGIARAGIGMPHKTEKQHTSLGINISVIIRIMQAARKSSELRNALWWRLLPPRHAHNGCWRVGVRWKSQ